MNISLRSILLVILMGCAAAACSKQDSSGKEDAGGGGGEPEDAAVDSGGGDDAAVAQDASAANCTPKSGTALATKEVGSGFEFPVFVTSPPADSRLFVVEKAGRIRILDRNGNVLETPFLDIANQVDSGGFNSEEGLLGMAFHPDYAQNGRFFVNYTADESDGNFTVIAEYKVSDDPDVASPEEKRLMRIDQPFSNHNAGMLAFGPDGYLYIGTGDGGKAGDPQDNGQDNTTLLGAMLRIDVNQGAPYAIPPDNPFADSNNDVTDPRPEIWAIGLRNPWRYSFDRETGDLYIGDVGQNQWEEIHIQPAASKGGENYGWDIMEGEACYQSTNCDTAGKETPAAVYPHNDNERSVTGGYVYRGNCIPDIRGWYFYADFVTSEVWRFEYKDGTVQNHSKLEVSLGTAIASFGQDADGELYVVNYGDGVIRRIVAAD